MGLTWLKSRFWQDSVPSGGCKKETVSLCFGAPRASCMSWLMAPSSTVEAPSVGLRPSHAVSGSPFWFGPLSHF